MTQVSLLLLYVGTAAHLGYFIVRPPWIMGEAGFVWSFLNMTFIFGGLFYILGYGVVNTVCGAIARAKGMAGA